MQLFTEPPRRVTVGGIRHGDVDAITAPTERDRAEPAGVVLRQEGAGRVVELDLREIDDIHPELFGQRFDERRFADETELDQNLTQ